MFNTFIPKFSVYSNLHIYLVSFPVILLNWDKIFEVVGISKIVFGLRKKLNEFGFVEGSELNVKVSVCKKEDDNPWNPKKFEYTYDVNWIKNIAICKIQLLINIHLYYFKNNNMFLSKSNCLNDWIW